VKQPGESQEKKTTAATATKTTNKTCKHDIKGLFLGGLSQRWYFVFLWAFIQQTRASFPHSFIIKQKCLTRTFCPLRLHFTYKNSLRTSSLSAIGYLRSKQKNLMRADGVMAVLDLLVTLQMLVGELLASDVAGVVQHLSRQLHVVVSELSDLSIVDAQDLGLLGGAEGEAGNQVHDEEDEAGSTKGIDHSADGIGKLVTKLDVVLVEPSTGDLGEAIKVRYVVGGEETGEDIADETANGVDGEDIESIVNSEEELELGGIVGTSGANDTEDHCCPSGHETGTRSDGHKTGNDTRAETDGGPFAFKTVVHHAPGDTTNAGCEVGHNGCHHGAQVSS